MTHSDHAPAVYVRLIGGLSVVRDGVAVRDADLANRRARSLLKLLAAEHGRLVSTDRIAEALWSDKPPGRPVENIAVLVSRLRRTLGTAAIGGNRAGYLLTTDAAVTVDVTQADHLVAQAEARLGAGEAKLASAAAGAALALLDAGPPIQDEDADWAQSLRARTAALLARAQHAAAEAALRSGDSTTARRVAEAAIRADPLDEVATRHVMTAHVLAREPGRALAAFDALRLGLADALGVDPSAQTRELHMRILRDEPMIAVDSAPRATAALASELIGRARELDALRAALASAADAEPTLLVITGEPGIGKTALLDEFAAIVAATGGRSLRSRCYETERSLFLQPVVDALEPVVAAMSAQQIRDVADDRIEAMRELFPGVGPLLEPAVPERGTADRKRRLAYETIAGLLRQLAVDQPVALLVDDAHHAGLATAELLHYLPRHLPNARVLIVAALRSDEGSEIQRRLASAGQLLEIGPLADGAVVALARRAGLADRAEQIMSRTRGHPLFVVETIQALASGDAGVPTSLRDAIVARVARAGPEAGQVLHAAAVIGTSFEPQLIAGLLQLGLTEAARRCEQLLPSRLVIAAGRSYEFAHDVVHEVLYAATPEPTRLSYHLAAADLLTDRPESAAAHSAAGGDWPRAARAWIIAATNAQRRYAASDADRLLTNAVDAAERANDVDLRARAHAERGHVREILGTYRDAERDLRAANRLAIQTGDQHLQLQVLRSLGGDVTVALGHPIGECERILQDALELASALGDRRSEADVLARLGVLACNQLRFDRSADLSARGLRAAQASGDEPTIAIALDGIKSSMAYLCDVDRLAEVVDQLEPMLRRHGDLFLLQWTVFESAFIPLARGDWVQARARVDEALELGRRGGRTTYEGWFHAHQGWMARLQADYEAAELHGRRGLAGSIARPHAWWGTFASATLATTLAEVGRVAEATDLLEAGLQQSERGEAPAYRLRCVALLAELTGSPELLAEADSVLADVSAPPSRAWLHGVDAYLAVAGAHLDRADVDAAQRVIDPLIVAARDCGFGPALAQGQVIAARCALARGDFAAAATAAAEAEQLAARLAMPAVAARAAALR